jgi:hypothetical protein
MAAGLYKFVGLLAALTIRDRRKIYVATGITMEVISAEKLARREAAIH